jgi:hypothetical protein
MLYQMSSKWLCVMPVAQVVHREELGDNAAALPDLAAGATKIDASNQYTNTQPSE